MQVLPNQSDEQLLRIVTIIVRGLKIVGLAPFSFQPIKNSSRNPRNKSYTSVFRFSKIGLAYNILLVILILVVGAFAIAYLCSIKYPNGSSTTRAIVITQTSLGILASCVITLSSGFRQKEAVSIMDRLLEVDRLLSGMKKHPRSQRTLSIFFIVQMIFSAFIWVTYWASAKVYIRSFSQGFTTNVTLFVIYWFVVEYSIVLAFVTRELESLNKNLSNFEEFPNYSLRPSVLHDDNLSILSLPIHCSQLANLKVLHSIRITLSEVSEDVANFFSISTLSSVACFSIAIISEIYYIVIAIVIPYDDFEVLPYLSAITSILICLYPLILLSFNVTETLKEAKLTGRIVHKVLARTTRPEIRKELEQFSLQLMHEKLTFMAHGFFSLDFTLIQSILENKSHWLSIIMLQIFATTATYLIIVIQFMQSEVDTSENF